MPNRCNKCSHFQTSTTTLHKNCFIGKVKAKLLLFSYERIDRHHDADFVFRSCEFCCPREDSRCLRRKPGELIDVLFCYVSETISCLLDYITNSYVRLVTDGMNGYHRFLHKSSPLQGTFLLQVSLRLDRRFTERVPSTKLGNARSSLERPLLFLQQLAKVWLLELQSMIILHLLQTLMLSARIVERSSYSTMIPLRKTGTSKILRGYLLEKQGNNSENTSR